MIIWSLWMLAGLLGACCLQFGLARLFTLRGWVRHGIPFSGGIGIALSVVALFLVGYALGLLAHSTLVDIVWHWKRLWFGASLLLLLGALDDIVTLGVRSRIVVQLLGVSLLLSDGPWAELLAETFPGLEMLWLPFFVIFGVALVNAVNFIDGIDGLAGGYTALCLGITLVRVVAGSSGGSSACWIESLLLLSVLGFLTFNWNRAQIYLGNAGSYFLGFLLLVQPIYARHAGQPSALLAPVLAVGAYPLCDLLWVVVTRLLARRSPFRGDRRHFHYLLVDRGFSVAAARGILLLLAFLGQVTLVFAG